MKKLLFIIAFGLFTSTNAQRADCYIPSGEKCPKSLNVGNNMEELDKKFEPKSRTYFRFPSGGRAFVVFKAFSKEPLYVLTNNKNPSTPEEIKEIINSIDFSLYFDNNSGVTMDLKKFIAKKSLTDTFILDTLGSPTKSYESSFNGKTALVMDYNYKRLRLYLINSIVVGYETI